MELNGHRGVRGRANRSFPNAKAKAKSFAFCEGENENGPDDCI